MKIHLQAFRRRCVFPAVETPAWAEAVERWYQLDAPAYCFTETYSIMKSDLGPSPDMMIVASPCASNATDRLFAVNGASSPSKFVHTLPNVRAVSLLQVMAWHGPLLCLQNDPVTVRLAIDQALASFESDESLNNVWIFSFDDAALETQIFILTRASLSHASILLQECEGLGADLGTDREWLDWVYKPCSKSFNLTDRYQATFTSGA